MTKATGTYYAVTPGTSVWLTLRIGTAGFAATDLVVGGALVLDRHEGDLRYDLGDAADLHLVEVKCYTTIKGSTHQAPNRVDYELTGGAVPWRATLREEPPDTAHDTFTAEFVLHHP